jgi:hypothetical protein
MRISDPLHLNLERGAHLRRFMRSRASLAAHAQAQIAGGACTRAHRRRFTRTRVVHITGVASACGQRKHASPAAHAHAHRRWFMRTRAAHAHAPRRRFMRTRAAPITGGACARVHSRWWWGVVAAYLARFANLQCSRSLRGGGASADGSSARGPARGPCRRLDW